jgi:thiamine biosynthesis lipoprotein
MEVDVKKRFLVCILFICVLLTACLNPEEADFRYETNDYQRFREVFFDVFDTVTIIVGYAKTQEEFDYFTREVMRAELHRLHQLFDIFNEYHNINNIYTINKYAGIAPVEVDGAIIELLQLSMKAYEMSGGLVNVAIGPVTEIWRESAILGVIPSMDALLMAWEFTDINDLVIDEEMSTVFLSYEAMSLDVGSIAKGFAIELATQAAIVAGFDAFSLSVGGDVRVTNAPLSGREGWGVGVLSPEEGEMLDVVLATNTSVFSSGDYLRYFVVDNQRFHHIIDPGTLMPATGHRTVTVVYPDATMADILSLMAFILDTDEGKEVLMEFGAKGMWMLEDGTIAITSNWSD